MGHPGQCCGDTVLPPSTPSGLAGQALSRVHAAPAAKPPHDLHPTRGPGCFGGPRADIYLCPGAVWKRASSAQRYFKSRGLAAAPGPNCLAQQGAVGEADPNTQGRAPWERAEPRARLRPRWRLAARQKMLLAAGGANSPGAGRNSQAEQRHFLRSQGISSLLAPATRSRWPHEPGRDVPRGTPTGPVWGQILGAEGVNTQGPRRA